MGADTPEIKAISAAEAIIVTLAITGDDGAFQELVRRRQGMVRNLLRRLSGNNALADDLAQETFIQAWRTLRTLRSPNAFGGWLRHISVNVWLQHLRHARITTMTYEEIEPHIIGIDEDSSGHIDLQKALTSLKPAERLCVVLSYSEGMTHAEIVAATGLPLGTVKSHVARGATHLRKLLDVYAEASI